MFSRAGPLIFSAYFSLENGNGTAQKEAAASWMWSMKLPRYRMWVKMRYTRDCVHVMLRVVGQADRGVEWLADPEDRSSENCYFAFEK